MTVIGEINIEHGKDVYAYFVDYEKAFDLLEWPKLFKALKYAIFLILKREPSYNSNFNLILKTFLIFLSKLQFNVTHPGNVKCGF